MNYETAKALKEAGFYQGAKNGNHHGNGTWFDEDGDKRDHDGSDNDTYNPCLHELIEACGDIQIAIIRSGYLDGDWLWECFTYISEADDGFNEYHLANRGLSTYGSTSEIAVAKLWLALKSQP